MKFLHWRNADIRTVVEFTGAKSNFISNVIVLAPWKYYRAVGYIRNRFLIAVMTHTVQNLKPRLWVLTHQRIEMTSLKNANVFLVPNYQWTESAQLAHAYFCHRNASVKNWEIWNRRQQGKPYISGTPKREVKLTHILLSTLKHQPFHRVCVVISVDATYIINLRLDKSSPTYYVPLLSLYYVYIYYRPVS